VLQGCERVILSPHIGGSTEEAQENIGVEVSSALTRYLEAGLTAGSVTLPMIDTPPAAEGCRIVNVHQNVPGVLLAINRVVAESGINVVSQQLGTIEEIGLLVVDLAIESGNPQARRLFAAIAALDTSLRTRLL
jgi:D-3-phosphoglycerate dehydrogenase